MCVQCLLEVQSAGLAAGALRDKVAPSQYNEVNMSSAGRGRSAYQQCSCVCPPQHTHREGIMRINTPEIRSVVDVFHLCALRYTTKVVE